MQQEEAAAIAVIDPDDRARTVASRLCEQAGYRVLPFARGDEFLSAGPLEQVTCILLDVSTPDRQGIEVLRRLAERGAAPPPLRVAGPGGGAGGRARLALRGQPRVKPPQQPHPPPPPRGG
ncbi:MAG: response regulator, partial [Allosphingosinicella sp.]